MFSTTGPAVAAEQQTWLCKSEMMPDIALGWLVFSWPRTTPLASAAPEGRLELRQQQHGHALSQGRVDRYTRSAEAAIQHVGVAAAETCREGQERPVTGSFSK